MKKIVLFALFLGNIMYLSGQESTSTYQIKFLEVNKGNSDYAVAMLEDDKLVFTSSANENASSKKHRNPRKELFIGDIDFDGEILNVKPVTNKENNKFNTTGIAYTNNLKTVYFSRNKYVRKSSKQELDKNKRLELYKANVDIEGNWVNIEKLSFNDDKFSTGYPTLNKDNTKLYFVSDRLPSMGKNDIFVVDIKKDGSFGIPRNLGKAINTTGEETTPFLTDKNILYFSSDGHQGKGNLDIFATEIVNNNASEVHHLESPINSINDDFAYIINQETNRGFFTSNRLQGKNNNDLYSFTVKKEKSLKNCFITVEGFTKDKESQELLKGTTVDLLDLKGALIQSVTTSDDGAFKFNVSCSKEYKLLATNDEYQKQIKQIEILEKNYHRTLYTNMNLTRLYDNVVEHNTINVTKDENITSINAIHFDFDKSNLRDIDLPELNKIVKIMKDNTNIKVEAAAYTDSRGSHAYNKLLSQRRANATVNYIISKGIDASRITGKGYGEEKLINQCVDGVQCSEEAHQMNRRTEFTILNKQAVNDQNKYKKKNNKLVINTKKPKEIDNSQKQVDAKTIQPQKERVLTVNNTQKPLENNNKSANTISSKSEEINKDLTIKKTIETVVIAEEVIEENKLTDHSKEIVAIQEQAVESSSKSNEVTKDLVVVNSSKQEIAVNNQVKEEKQVTIVKRPRSDNKAENYIDDQKEKVIEKLIVLEEKFEEASTKNTELKDSFLSEKQKITEFKNEVIKDERTGWANIINYNNKIISFNKTYMQLMQSVEQKETTTNDNIKKSNKKKYLYKKPEVGESVSSIKKVQPKQEKNDLDIKNIQVTAMKKNNKGNYAETNSAKKTDMIKVSFKLLQNKNVEPGKKEAYFVLQNPQGKVANAKGVFTSESTNKSEKFTDSTIIDYNNNDVDIIMFVDRVGYEYERGNYPVKLFLEGKLAAESNLNLSGGL